MLSKEVHSGLRLCGLLCVFSDGCFFSDCVLTQNTKSTSQRLTARLVVMLAPSAITIRRPSCEADLILTRIESEPPFYAGLCTSDSVQSAPLYDCWAPNEIPPGELRPDGTGDRLCVTKRRKDSLISTTSGPDPRGRYWHRRSVPRICEDTTGSEPSGVGQGGGRTGVVSGDGGFRRASLTLRRSIDSLLCSLSSPKKSVDQTGLTIEVIQESPLFRRRTSRLGQRRKSLDKVHEDIDDDSFFAQSNLSLSLVLTSLKDGCLCAEIPIEELEEVPSGHVTIRVRNFNLDVSLSSGDKSCFRELPREPCYRGTVALPIYVNPGTLQFRLDESKNVVHLEGKIKGCCTRIGSSLSAMELSSQAGLSAGRVSTAVAGAGM